MGLSLKYYPYSKKKKNYNYKTVAILWKLFQTLLKPITADEVIILHRTFLKK